MAATNTQRYRITTTAISDVQLPKLQAKLADRLPYSLPLFRRIQFQCHRRRRRSIQHEETVDWPKILLTWAQMLDASPLLGAQSAHSGQKICRDPPSPQDESQLDAWIDDERGKNGSIGPWIAASVDLREYGQTQVWLFASWESLGNHQNTAHPAAQRPPSSGTDATLEKQLFRAFFQYIHARLIPSMPTTPSADWLELKRSGKWLSTPYSRDKVLFGTVNEIHMPHFDPAARTRLDVGFLKYCFKLEPRPAPDAGGAAVLPLGYSFGPLQLRHLQMVFDRTPVPRTIATLSRLVALGVFFAPEESAPTSESNEPASVEPIAWGFLSTDASLISLHTEPEHRGRGLAACLGAALLARQRDAFADSTDADEQTMGWAHADVAEQNTASRRVMEKLGGIPTWTVSWTEVDLDKIVGRSSQASQEMARVL